MAENLFFFSVLSAPFNQSFTRFDFPFFLVLFIQKTVIVVAPPNYSGRPSSSSYFFFRLRFVNSRSVSVSRARSGYLSPNKRWWICIDVQFLKRGPALFPMAIYNNRATLQLSLIHPSSSKTSPSSSHQGRETNNAHRKMPQFFFPPTFFSLFSFFFCLPIFTGE